MRSSHVGRRQLKLCKSPTGITIKQTSECLLVPFTPLVNWLPSEFSGLSCLHNGHITHTITLTLW